MDLNRVVYEPTNRAGVTSETLVLDADARCIRGIDMEPLLSGEFMLLAFLGTRARIWQTSRGLSVRVYDREDPGGLQLVWKYTSTLRKKLSASLPGLLEVCRRRGYRCAVPLRVVSHDASEAASTADQLDAGVRA